MFLNKAIIWWQLLVIFLSVFNNNYIQSEDIMNGITINRDMTLRTSRKYHLPLPTGPYPNIGHIDLMTGTDKNDGVLVRILYPSSNQSVDLKETTKQWSNWYPRNEYREGYLNAVNVTSSVLIKLNSLFSSDVFIPTVENVDPLQLDNQAFPVIIFSHGLSSCRTTYSSVCYELVSYGFIVFEIEHRDGSACTTFYPNKDNKDGKQPFNWLPYKHKSEFKDEFEGRTQQLEVRLDEIKRVLDIINDLQNGNQIKNVLKTQIDSQKFKGIFDVNKIIAMGHSFGSATTIKAVYRIETIKLGICLDAWMYGLKDIDTTLVKKPLLFVNMETFQWLVNLREMKKYIPNDGENSDQRKVLTIKEGRHTDPSDLPFVLNSLVKRITKMNSKVDPFVVHDLCTALSLQFIEDILQIKLKKNKNDFIEKYRNHLRDGLEDIETLYRHHF